MAPLDVAGARFSERRRRVGVRQVVLVERADELGDGDGVRVVADEPHHEHAVLLQVLVDEARHLLRVVLVVDVDVLHQQQVLLDVAVPVRVEDAAQRPREQAEQRHGEHEHHPEPDEQVDHFVEEVDRQHALHRVALNVAQPPHLEVAHGDAREARRLAPVLAATQRRQHVDAVHVVVGREERVEQEQLADHVGDVKQLHPHVERHQVVAVPPAREHAQRTRQAVLQADRAARLHRALVLQVPAAETGNETARCH